jgi:hypothetical protein
LASSLAMAAAAGAAASLTWRGTKSIKEEKARVWWSGFNTRGGLGLWSHFGVTR